MLDRTAVLNQPLPAREGEVRAELTRRYRAAMRKSVEGIIEAGRVLIDGKERLPHGKFIEWVTGDLRLGDEKMGIRKADMLMNIAHHEVISNSHHWYQLPSSWRTLYELTLIKPNSRLLALIANGKINSGMTREEAIALRSAGNKTTVTNYSFSMPVLPSYSFTSRR